MSLSITQAQLCLRAGAGSRWIYSPPGVSAFASSSLLSQIHKPKDSVDTWVLFP